MNYAITCVCGNRFFITEQQLSGQVACTKCGRPLIPVISLQQPAPPAADSADLSADPSPPSPPAEPAVAASAEATKRCPFCGEIILAIARKCKHCGEFLDRAAPPSFAGSLQSPRAPQTAGASPHPPNADPASGPGFDNAPVFTLSVSQWDNFWKYVICVLIVAGVVTALVMVPPLRQYRTMGIPGTMIVIAIIMSFFYMATRSSRCIIRPMRVDTEVGILSKDLASLELFRIIDYELKQGWIERLLGIGTIRLTSNDPNTQELILYQIPRAREVYKYLQQQIPAAARLRGAVYFER